MVVLSFKSKYVQITVNTGVDLAKFWNRFKARVEDNEEARIAKKALSYCDYQCTIPGVLELAIPPIFKLEEMGEMPATTWRNLPPVFYETVTYNISILLQNLEGRPYVLHKLKEVTELFSVINIGENNWLISAPLSFINEPGIFNLRFRYKRVDDCERTDTFTFRVVSPKLDTKEDYNHILADINSQYNEIIYQYLTLTLQNFERGGRSNNDIVWLSIFRHIVKNYERWIRYIVHRPHLRQSRKTYYSRADQIKRWPPGMEEYYYRMASEGRLEKQYFRHDDAIHTHDTRENRFVKYTLERIGRRLDLIVATIHSRNDQAKETEKVAPSELAELDNYVSSLRRLSKSRLLRNLHGEPLRMESIVLQKRTGYSQVYKYWLLLQKGIELFEGSNAIGVRPIWELYELWCFLMIRKMVAEILGLEFGNPTQITENPMPMIKPFEDNTQEHTIVYNGTDGLKVRLQYQHTYNRRSGEVHTATTENRPDIVLTIIGKDGLELTYLFDAKYRLLDDRKLSMVDQEEFKEIEGSDTPPSDAINQMHRYRDAIYYGSDRREHAAKEIIGGYILFPGRGDNESVRERYFYKSIETVNIGAFPLLPDVSDPLNKGSLLYEFLVRILTAPSASDHLHSAIPQKGLEYYNPTSLKPDDLVLVGYYKSEQLEAILTNRLYYVPAALGKGSINLVSGFEKTKYLLLHHGEDRQLVRLMGTGPKFCPRPVLEEKGFSPTGEYFLAFDIKDIHPISEIDISSYCLERSGRARFAPYFTTIEKINGSGKKN